MPYGNKALHCGHVGGLFVHADTFARFMRDRIGKENVIFVSGTDCYGSPIMEGYRKLKDTSKFEGSIEDYVKFNHDFQKKTLNQYQIGLDLYAASGLEPAKKIHEETSKEVFEKLMKNKALSKMSTLQFYDEKAKCFLNGRQVVGKCPFENCASEKAYADECDLGHQYMPKELIDPVSTLTGEKPVLKEIVDFYDWEFENYNCTPMGCVCGGLFRLDFLNKHNIRMRSGIYYEDELFIYNIYTHTGNTLATHIQEPYYYYRLGREGSTVSSLKQKNFQDRLIVVREMQEILRNSTYKTIARQHKIFEMYLQNLIEAYQNGFIRLVTKLMTKRDVELMQEGAISAHEKKLLRLLRISPRLMSAYKTNQLPSIVRRCINIFIK
jgi:hypothetical protein